MASELNDKDRLVLRIIGDSCEKKGQDNIKFEEINNGRFQVLKNGITKR
ncbi:MAG: hypothetical protein ACP5GY_07765 [Vulcanisaeta sp.]